MLTIFRKDASAAQPVHNSTIVASEKRAAISGPTGVLLILCGLVIVYSLIQLPLYGFGRDQGIYATVGRTILQGGMPYRDAWDFKPPGIYLIYALAQLIFGANQWGVRLLETLGLISLIPAFLRLSLRFTGGVIAGIFGCTIAILTHAQLDFLHSGEPESFAAFFTFYGIYFIVASPGKSTRPPTLFVRLGISAMMFGLAGLMKPHFLLAAVPAAAYLWTSLEPVVPGRGKRGLYAALYLAASGIPLAAVLVWIAAKGAFGAMIGALFVFAPHYVSLTWGVQFLPKYLYRAFEVLFVGSSAFLMLGSAFFLFSVKNYSNRARRAFLLIGSVIFVHLIGIAIQSKFFPYHFGATFPLASCLAGFGFAAVWKSARRQGAFFLALFLAGLLFIAPMRTPAWDFSESFWERSRERLTAWLSGDKGEKEIAAFGLNNFADVNYMINVKVAAWLAGHTNPSDKVYIWGFEPIIYFLAFRGPASAYIYNVPQRVDWGRDAARRRLMEDLSSGEPAVIVVESRDIFPWVVGNSLDSASTLKGFPELASLIECSYIKVLEIEDFLIYRRLGTMPSK